jgi:hypothetical protein
MTCLKPQRLISILACLCVLSTSFAPDAVQAIALQPLSFAQTDPLPPGGPVASLAREDAVMTETTVMTDTATVSGYITDVKTDWPLYAHIWIEDEYFNFSWEVWSDPLSGYYEVDLYQGFVYNIYVNAWVDGYQGGTATIGPLFGDLTLDFSLEIDSATCATPGYQFAYMAFSEDFETSVGDFSVSGTNASWEWGLPVSGPGVAHSGEHVWGTGLLGNYADNEDGYLTSPPIDLRAYSGQPLSLHWWQYLVTESWEDTAHVEVSKDGGTSWESVYRPGEGVVDLNWNEHAVTLDPAYAVSDFQMRFHFTSNYEKTAPGWYLDDITIFAGNCESPAGGLVVGQVFAEDFLLPLTGATVSNDSSETATARATDDPALGDAFYTLYSPAGTHIFTATMPGCNTVVAAVDIPQDGAVMHDFLLPSGALALDPAALSVSLDMGISQTVPLTLSNLGARDLSFEVWENDAGFQPLEGLRQGNSNQVQPKILLLVTSDSSESVERVMKELGYRYNLYIHDNWSEIDFSPYDMVVVSINDSWGYVNAGDVEKIRTDVIDQGKRLILFGGTCFQDFAEGVNAYLVASDPQDYCWKTSASPHWTLLAGDHRLARGLPDSLDFLNQPAASYQTLVTDTHIETIAVNGDGAPIFFYKDGFFPEIEVEPQPPLGDLIWFVNSAGEDVWYNRVDFEILKQLLANALAYPGRDDPSWLSETPLDGTIPGGGQSVETQDIASLRIDVTFDTAQVGQPGNYLANLLLLNDTPYPPLQVPLTMTVAAPPSWGKLEGTVSSLGHCDLNPDSLGHPDLHIESSAGLTWTVEADEAGDYVYWLDEAGSPYTVTVSAPDHQGATQGGVMIVGQQTTLLDFNLRWLVPCLNADPTSLALTLPFGEVGTLPLTLTNSGAGEANFELKDEDRGYQEAIKDTVLVVEDEPDNYLGMEAALTELGVPYQAISPVDFTYAPVEDLLAYRAVFYGGLSWWGSLPYFHVIEYLDAGGRFYIADNDLGYNLSSTPLYEYLQATWVTDDGGDILTGQDIMAGMVVDTSLDPYPDGFTVGAEGVPIFIFSESGYAGGVRVNRNGYKAVYTAWDYVYVTPVEAKAVIARVLAYLTDDSAWLSADPMEGSLPADGGMQSVNVSFDTQWVTQPGEHYANLMVWSNDPPNNPLRLPVTMTVEPSPDYGQLTGTVRSLGKCDIDPAPLQSTLVSIQSSDGMSWMVKTDSIGSYEVWLDQARSPYTLTVTAPEHQTMLAGGVVVVGGAAQTLDFDLRLLASCVSVAPASLLVDVEAGQRVTVTLTLSNSGTISTPFSLAEIPPETPLRSAGLAQGRGEWLYRSDKGLKLRNNLGEIATAYPGAYRWTPTAGSDLRVLIYSDDWFHWQPDTFLDQALRALGIAYTAHYDGDYYYFLKDLEKGDWDMVLVGNDMWYNDVIFSALNDYVVQGGLLALHTWMMSDLLDEPLWTNLGVVWISDDEAPPDPIYWWQPDHPLFNDPQSVPEFTELQERLWYNGQRVEPLDGFDALAGFTTPGPNPDEAALVFGNSGRTIFKGFIDSTNDADLDSDGMMDGVELWINMITMLEGSLGSDVPWLSATPVTGTLAADSSLVITLTLDALDYPSGSYQAILTVRSTDPLIEIPVTMNVLPAGETHYFPILWK